MEGSAVGSVRGATARETPDMAADCNLRNVLGVPRGEREGGCFDGGSEACVDLTTRGGHVDVREGVGGCHVAKLFLERTVQTSY